jgi:PAS domain S-box-containing protein
MKKPPIPNNENERLKNLQLYDILDTAQEETFDDLTELAASICEAPIALISLIDENRQWFKSRVGLPATETSRDISFCGHAINQPDLFIVPDATEDNRFSDNPLVTQEPAIRFYAGAPLISPEGHALGTLCVIDRESRKMKTDHQNALRILSRHVMTQLELRRKTTELKGLQIERDSAVDQLHKERLQIETLVKERTKKLNKSEENSRKLVEQAEHSRRALLSILEDQKETEQSLRESETKYRFLFESMTQGVFYQNADGGFLDINKAALTMFGLTREQFFGRTPFDPRWKVVRDDHSIMSPDEYPSLIALKTGKLIQNVPQGIFNPKKKNYTWISTSAIPEFRANEKKPYRVFVTFHNITKRKQAEDNLKVTIDRLERFHRVVVDRELRMIELKKEVNKLLEDGGKPKKYQPLKNRKDSSGDAK